MFFGRLLGWSLLLIAVFTASAEAVAALSTGEYSSIATSDILTIITGLSPSTNTVAGQILLWPAWLSIGIVGISLIFLCRRKKIKSSFSLKS
ncbi:MAG: hypothetical protein J5787_09540 [Alphaproteobacteria bacterium]|nr:hypothetical protein [Alphaproteobacteria bacterium]MBO4644001.1 hypothetical protein [Alphaproteobacteria bacterium]